MITPKLDWMIVRKIEKKGVIIEIEGAKSVAEMKAFEILSIGPGKYQNGVFIKTLQKSGDKVFINGPVIETKYDSVTYFFSKEEYVVAEYKGKD
jgi:hypothetical protein